MLYIYHIYVCYDIYIFFNFLELYNQTTEYISALRDTIRARLGKCFSHLFLNTKVYSVTSKVDTVTSKVD